MSDTDTDIDTTIGWFTRCKELFYTMSFSNCMKYPAPPYTGTIICPIDGQHLRLCIQQNSSSSPLTFLELPLSAASFSSLIQHGTIRLVFECGYNSTESLLGMPMWMMYCNGRKMGFASRVEVTGVEAWLLEMLQPVSAGVGIYPDEDSGGYKYLRGQFEQIVGSVDSESYHLIDLPACLGQELSLFFLRSSSM